MLLSFRGDAGAARGPPAKPGLLHWFGFARRRPPFGHCPVDTAQWPVTLVTLSHLNDGWLAVQKRAASSAWREGRKRRTPEKKLPNSPFAGWIGFNSTT